MAKAGTMVFVFMLPWRVNRWLQRVREARQKLLDDFCAQSDLTHTQKKNLTRTSLAGFSGQKNLI